MMDRMIDNKNARFDSRRITVLSFLVCIGLVASIIENLFPPIIPLAPGAKLGLGNVAPLLALIILGVPDAFIVAAVKCLIGAVITGTVSGLMYSVPAAFAALAVETLIFKTLLGKTSIPMISLIGAMIFNAVQLSVACLVTGVNLFVLLPWMLTAGFAAGAFTGLLAYSIVKRLPYSVYGKRR